jgi:uncharacterized membrane protein
MKGMGFAKVGAKGLAAKGGFLKGIFGFVGGVFKLLFFGFFLIIFLIIGLVLFFAMRKKLQNQNFKYPKNHSKEEDDIIDAEIIETYPTKR